MNRATDIFGAPLDIENGEQGVEFLGEHDGFMLYRNKATGVVLRIPREVFNGDQTVRSASSGAFQQLAREHDAMRNLERQGLVPPPGRMVPGPDGKLRQEDPDAAAMMGRDPRYAPRLVELNKLIPRK